MKKKVFSLMMTLLLAIMMPGAMFAQVGTTTSPGLHTLATYGGVEMIDSLVIERPNGAWMEPYHFQLFNNGADTVEVVLIDFLHNNGYFSMVNPHYPFLVENNGRPGAIDLYIATADTLASPLADPMYLAVNTTERSTHLYRIVANPYTPYCPDVVELAYDFDTLTEGFTWQNYMSAIWAGPGALDLHDNYTLPLFEDSIPDGYDAVMKFTVDHDVMLDASVSVGANGKVVLYREGFEGRPGPMADNYYAGRPYHADDENGGTTFHYDYDFEFEADSLAVIPAGFYAETDSATTNIPWIISADTTHTDNYVMMSGNAGVNNSSSAISIKVDYVAAGTVSFDFFASGESDDYSNIHYDQCIFMIDGEVVFIYGEDNTWRYFETEVAAGEHVFTWVYTKDVVFGSIYDCFMVDNVVFEGGHVVIIPDPVWDNVVYDFETGTQGWTMLQDTAESTSPNTWMHNTAYTPRPEFHTGHGRNGSNGFMLSESFISAPTEGSGTPVIPDNYLISPKIMLGGYIHFWATSPSQNFGEEHISVEVSTTNNTDINAFEVVDEWTLPFDSLRRTGNTRTLYDNVWIEYEADLRAYSDSGYVAIHHYNCQDLWMVCVDDITLYMPHTDTEDPTTPVVPETPEVPVVYTIGPEIQGMNVVAGTYYLVASSTDPDFEVTINVNQLPCPMAVTPVYPIDNDREVPVDQDLILRWRLDEYCNEWRLVFSSTYWPEDEPADTTVTPEVPGHPQTFITPWSSDLQESFNISEALAANGLHPLWHNTNYFWRIEQRNVNSDTLNCPPAPVFGFTTCLNRPLNMTASTTRMFEHEDTLILRWDAVVDRTYRTYRIYMDSVLIGSTTLHEIGENSFIVPDSLLTYNLDNENGYIFHVSAVYDEGESPWSNPFEIYVSGRGVISGTVYEQDGQTGIGGATVTVTGYNDFMEEETYTYTTNSVGFYIDSTIHAGSYFEDSIYYGTHYQNAVASMEGYQDATTVHVLPFDLPYNDTVDHVDFLMDELFVAPAHVCAQTVSVPGVQGDTLVQVWWDFNFFETLFEDFEDWDNTPFAWQNDATYPWVIVQEGEDGSYCMKSTNSGNHGTTSVMEVTVNIPQDGEFSFDLRSDGESATSDTYDWDVSRFYIDGEQMFQYGLHMVWEHYSQPITAGTHTFKWEYKKDGSVHPSQGDDCFRVDNIYFVANPDEIGMNRSLHHYNIYRTDCYNDGPYNDSTTTFLASVWRPDTSYFDVSWPTAAPGVYKFGVSAVYQGNYAGNPNNPRVDYPFEPRESQIIWSNECNCGMGCIDKDMYMDGVTIHVVLNSADSPEGTVVTFVNTNPGEELNHPMGTIVLDSTGYYAFPRFRRGNYNITLEHDGYFTMVDYKEIWEPMDLRYVLIEKIFNARELYVSRTGWAMWQPNGTLSNPQDSIGSRHLEGYKVLCTSLDGEPIFNHNTPVDQPFCQLTTVDPYSGEDVLIEGERYILKVAAIYSTGMSSYISTEWQYEPCDHWGPVDEVTVGTSAEGNHIEWVFEHGHNQWEGEWEWDEPIDPPTPPTQVATVILTAGDVWGDGSGYQMLLDADATAFGTVIPEEGALTTGGDASAETYAEFEYKIPVNADGSTTTNNMVINNSISIEIPAGTYDWCITNPTPGDRIWIASAQGNVGGRQNDYTFEAGKTYEFTVSMLGSNDQVNVVITGGAKNMRAPLPCGEAKTAVNLSKKGGNSVVYNLNTIMNYNERVFFLYNLVNDGRFDVVSAETAGRFIITADDAFEGMNVEEAFSDFREQNAANYAMMDKEEAYATALRLKPMLPADFMVSLLSYDYTRSRENNMCELANPVCSDSTYFFPAPVGNLPSEEGPFYDCLSTQPRPVWYYLRIGAPGDLEIYMHSNPQIDIDFCCWGPFEDPTTPCPNGLTEDKVVDCSYSTSWNETCDITGAQTGEYYILVITNYNGGETNITFSQVSGEGDTDCAIVVEHDPAIGFLITQDGEYLDIVGPNVREYTDIDEFGNHVYCVRPIYPGSDILPDSNYYYSMGCPVCFDMSAEPTCDAGDPIFAEVNDTDDQVHLWWGDMPQPEQYAFVTLTAGDVWGDGTGYQLLLDADATAYGTIIPETGGLTTSGDAPAGLYDNFEYKIPENADGALATTNIILNNTLTIMIPAGTYDWCVTNPTPGDRLWIAGNGRGDDMVFEANMSYTFTVELAGTGDNVTITSGAKSGLRSEIVSYNIYRSEDNVAYELIGNVEANAANWYEYFDTPGAGSYYYQVTAVYSDGCESEPALSGEDPEVNYVMVGVTGIGENNDNVNLFPNPTKGNVTIQAKGMNRITVVSVLGQVVYDTKLDQDEYVLNMAQFNTGMYMVRIFTENGVTVKRVSVMH